MGAIELLKSKLTLFLASLIIATGLIILGLSNRFYIDTSAKLKVDRLTGKTYKLTDDSEIWIEIKDDQKSVRAYQESKIAEQKAIESKRAQEESLKVQREIERKIQESINKQKQAEKDKEEAFKVLKEYSELYLSGMTYLGRHNEGIPLRVYAGLLNKELIPKDSKLFIEDKAYFDLMLASGDFPTDLEPYFDEILTIEETGYFSIENDFIKKLIEEDTEFGLNKDWYIK